MPQKFPLQATAQQILSLVTGIPETQTVEYTTYDFAKMTDKTSLVCDVSAFANTYGGELVLGIDAPKGLPVAISGIAGATEDDLKRLIDHVLSDGADPPIRDWNAEFTSLTDVPGKYVIVLGIPPSWNAPHLVTHNKNGKFYSRGAANRQMMTRTELQLAFFRQADILGRLRDRRMERIKRILQRDEWNPIRVKSAGTLVLHVLPASSVLALTTHDITAVYDTKFTLAPMTCGDGQGEFSDFSRLYNISGVLKHAGPDRSAVAYTEFTRHGAVEAVWAFQSETSTDIFAFKIELELRKTLSRYLNSLRDIGVGTPLYIFVSLCGIKGHDLIGRENSRHANTSSIPENILRLPEQIITNYEVNSDDVAMPMINALWQAFGQKQSPWVENGKFSIPIGSPML